MNPKAGYVFEVSWEVANKVGGIYTVLESKAQQMVRIYKEKYTLVGPYQIEKLKGHFEETPPGSLKTAFSALEAEGITCHTGKWLIKGEPQLILVDFSNIWPQINEFKRIFWESYHIDSLNSPKDFDEPFLWSYASGKVIEKLIAAYPSYVQANQEKIVVHAHEWLSAATLLYLKMIGFRGGTVFSTHATTLGRTLANNGVNLYTLLDKIDPDSEAYRYGIQTKHLLEKVAAQTSDVFTTVSEITAIEAEHFLRRKPEVLLPNGLDISQFPTFEELTLKHRVYRNRMREFLLYYFFPYYSLDTRQTLFYFLLGRYEFRNKGVDIFIKSLGLLNKRLRSEDSKKTIITFFWIPSAVRGVKSDLLESREVYRDIKESLQEVFDEVEANILTSLMSGQRQEEIQLSEIFEKEFLVDVKKKALRLKREGLPSLSTHDLLDPNDIVIRSFKEAGLENKKEDKVKVIFYPVYLGGSDGMLNLSYYESIQGSHLGVFPSFYEPWGYTPLETAALGVAAATTDLAGFGRFFCNKCEQKERPGIFFLERFGKEDQEVIAKLADLLYSFSKFSHAERIENKIQARKMASLADWNVLIENYIQAYSLSLEKSKRHIE